MKRYLLFVSLMGLLCTNIHSQNLKISDFDLPVTSAKIFSMGGNFNLNSNDSITNFIGNLNLKYSKFYSSLPSSYSIYADINFDAKDAINRYENVVNSSGNSYKITSNITLDYDKYFSDKSKFYFNINSVNFLNSGFHLDYAFDPSYFQSHNNLGIGFGRIVDATSMAQALRIQEYLIDEKQLTDEMDKEIVMEVAQHCNKLNQYEITYGQKFQEEWFFELEKIMQKSGKLTTGNLNPFSVLRIMEVLYSENIYFRPYGWQVETNLNFVLSYYETGYFKNDVIGTVINFQVGYPINNRLHFYQRFFYRYSFDNDFTYKNFLFASTSMSYNLTNRFNLGLNYYFQTNSGNSNTNKYHSFKLTTMYYIENNVSINLEYNLINQMQDASFDYYNRTNNTINLGFNYRFW